MSDALPAADEWRAEARRASPSLAADAAVFDHVLERFGGKYLRAALSARTIENEQRAWDSFYFWLVFPQTDRKPFAIPEAEADALIAAFRQLAARLGPSAAPPTP